MSRAQETVKDLDAEAGRKHDLRLAMLGLLTILALALGLRLHFFVGCLGSDDLETWQVADALSKGRLAPDQIFQNPIAALRYGPAIPMAVIFRFLGNSEQTVMIYPICVSLIAIVAVWDITRRLSGHLWAAHVTGMILALTSLDIHFSTVALPDGPMAAVSLLSIWCCVVGYERATKSSARGAGFLFFLAGFLAAFALMHKVSAAQLAAALGLWVLALAVLGKWRRAFWLMIVGLLAGVIFEHLLVWLAYGNPIYRWHTIYDESLKNTARRMQVATEPLPLTDRLVKWLGMIAETLPSFTIVAGAGLLAACYYLVRYFKQPKTLLVCLYILAVLGMRLPELTQTHSYQPRRLLPLAGGAAILLGITLARRRRRSWSMAVAGTFLIVQAGLFALYDARETEKQAARVFSERWLFNWIRSRPDIVQRHGVYVDHRTFKVLYGISGFDDLRAKGVHLYASEPKDSYWIYGERHREYREGAYFFENPRVLQWLLPYSHDNAWFSVYPMFPKSWPLVAIARHPTGQRYNAALYQITSSPRLSREVKDENAGPRSDRPAVFRDAVLRWSEDRLHNPGRKQYYGWYADEPDGNTIDVETGNDGESKLIVDFRQGKRLRLFSGKGGPTSPPAQSSLLTPGHSLRLSYSARQEGAMPSGLVRTGLIGYDERGAVVVRRFKSFWIGDDWSQCVVDLGDEPDVVGVRVMIQLKEHGRYKIGPVRLTQMSSVFAPDLRFHPEQGGRRPFYYGWYFNGPTEGFEIDYEPGTSNEPARIVIDSSGAAGLSLTSGGPMTKSPPPSLFCRRGDSLKVTLPVHVDLTSLKRSWAESELLVLGYTRQGERRKLYSGRHRLYYERQNLRAYVVAEDDLCGLKVSFKLKGRGRVGFEEPTFQHFPNLPPSGD